MDGLGIVLKGVGAGRDALVLGARVSNSGVDAEGMEFEGEEEGGLGPGLLQTLTRAGNLALAVDV